ncbi:hypothetical protein ABTP37_10875 [Acinetobacter baumannii]
MATNWNAILANINNASDILAILRKVLGLLDGKVDLTRIDEIIAHIVSMQMSVDDALTSVNSALSEFDKEAQQAIQQVISAGLMEGFTTEAELLASRPSELKKYAKAEDTDVIWFWNKPEGSPDGNYWVSTGLGDFGQSLKEIKNLCKVNTFLNTDSQIEQNAFYYSLNGTTVIKDTNPALFSVQADAKEGDYFILNTQSFSVADAFYFTDASNNIIEKMQPNEALKQSYLLRAPALASKLYVNCLKEYSSSFSFSKLPKGNLELMYGGYHREQFTFYTISDGGPVRKQSNHGVFALSLDVTEGECYLIDTKGLGIADEYYVTDSSGNLLSFMSTEYGTDAPYILKIPKLGTKLYLNCAYSYSDKFFIQKIPSAIIADSNIRLDFTFFYSANGTTIRRENNTGLFAVDIDVEEDQYYSINTQSFGVADEYCIADSNGNLLDKKASNGLANGEYIVKMPATAKKLYVNCTYAYKSSFNVMRVSSSLIESIPKIDQSVRSVFPNFNYFDKLRVKCPNFYRKFKDKNQDVTVVLTGTSLTQGNLYASDRADATTRPAALHTNDLASSVFDKLIKHWDGQKYRRYDHTDLTYSNSTWVVTNNASGGIWDDYAHVKNGLTKTTTDANASVSITIPSNAWQFNFVYRSDSQSGNCTISINEGNGKVELYNGSEWIEANGATFSMYESPATETKGNTQYQKRLKMRCKNKSAGGINSIGSTKRITISKGDNANRFNVVGFEWSQREFMLSVINGARGGHEWGDPTGNRLDKWQDTDIWSFNPDLLLAEVTIINWGASEAAAMSVDPLHYVNIAKRAYFNEFNDMPTSLYAKSSAYTVCDVIFYSDTLAATSAVSGAWDSTTHEPLFGTVTTAASNGGAVDNTNIGRVKNNFENYEAVERYIASKDYLFIPVLSSFKYVAEKFYGGYWQGMQASDKTGNTLSYDGVHFNDNGAALFSKIVASVFDEI